MRYNNGLSTEDIWNTKKRKKGIKCKQYMVAQKDIKKTCIECGTIAGTIILRYRICAHPKNGPTHALLHTAQRFKT